MKKLSQILLVLLVGIFVFSCNQPQNRAQKSTVAGGQRASVNEQVINVYYFHTNVRCETCLAVENHTRNLLKELFPREMTDGEIVYQVFNVEKPGHEDLIEKYKVWGQALLFVKGDTVIDRTNDAFMNVLEEPQTWRSMVKTQIDELLKL